MHRTRLVRPDHLEMELLNALCRLAEYAQRKVLSSLKHYCRQSIFPRLPASVAGAADGVGDVRTI